MHLIFGAHNLHQFYLIVTNQYYGASQLVWRRPWPVLLWSLLGACGLGAVRNVYTSCYGYNAAIVGVTWIWEWTSLGLILVDFGYFLVVEHSWGMAMKQNGGNSGSTKEETSRLKTSYGSSEQS